MYKSTPKKYNATRHKKEKKERKKLAMAISPKAEGTLSRLVGFGTDQNKSLTKLYLPNIEINLAIAKDHSISCRPNDPACRKVGCQKLL